MSLFASPEIHAANGPETWTVVKPEGSRRWVIQTRVTHESGYMAGQPVTMGTSFDTKREATAALTDGFEARLWEKERRWYAGEQITGWKPYATVKAENEASAKKRAEAKAKEDRKTERMGVTLETVKEWEDASQEFTNLNDSDWPHRDDPEAWTDLEWKLRDLADKMSEMVQLIQSKNLLNPDELTRDEAQELATELDMLHGIDTRGGAVTQYIDRIKYHGLDADRPALEILEEIERAAA